MNLNELLDALFPRGHKVAVENNVVVGRGTLSRGEAAIIGTTGHAAIGLRELTALSRAFLDVIRAGSNIPVVIPVDNSGQRMALEEELLGLSQAIALCVKTQDLARRNGHPLVAVVYGEALAGAFVACGLGADRVCAVPEANTAVMNLPAIARVTKIGIARLETLAKTVPIFAPGCDNFFKMGGLHEIWTRDFNNNLERVLAENTGKDNRSQLGSERGGRQWAGRVIRDVLNA